MSAQDGAWCFATIGIFGAEVSVDEAGRRVLAITTPDGVQRRYVFTAENAQTIGRQLLAPGVVVPNFPPDQ